MTDDCLRLKQLWIEALSRHPNDLRVVKAGARFLSWYAPALALEAYERASALEPDRGDWKHDMARMHSRLADHAEDQAARTMHLRAAESLLRDALARALPDVKRSVLVVDLAWSAVALEQWSDAATRAAELLESAKACLGTWQYGNAIHHGHIVLGEVALAGHDLERADDELRAAGDMPGSPQLNTFGPELGLAGALARLGRRDAVIAYLESCKKFWKHPRDTSKHRSEIDEWLAALHRGDLPDFAVEETDSAPYGDPLPRSNSEAGATRGRHGNAGRTQRR
jgi:hypothetical protein